MSGWTNNSQYFKNFSRGFERIDVVALAGNIFDKLKIYIEFAGL